MFQEKLIILYMREKQMFIYSVVSIQWWKQYYRKKNYLVVHQPGGEGRGREGRWGEGVTTDLPAKWVTWRLLPQAKWVNYLLKSLELHKHANLFMKSKRQDSSPACLRLLKFGGQVLPSSLSQKCWISKKCMKQFYDQEIKYAIEKWFMKDWLSSHQVLCLHTWCYTSNITDYWYISLNEKKVSSEHGEENGRVILFLLWFTLLRHAIG